MNTFKRREFIKTMAASSAGFAIFNNLNFSAYANPAERVQDYIGGITEIAILNDVAKLSIRGGLVTAQTAEIVRANINQPIAANLSRMGMLVKEDESKVEGMLKKICPELKMLKRQISKSLELQKDKNSGPRKEELKLEKKISLLLGWYMAAGIRTELWQGTEKAEPSEMNLPSEMSIYQDMYVLKQVAGTVEKASVTDIKLLFQGIQPRMICRTHTITPDYDDGPAWTVRITNWRNDSMALMERYAQAYVNPDPQKVERFIKKINFYNPNDSVIQLARWVQDGKTIKSIDILLDEMADQSIYARALAKGIVSLQKAERIIAGL